MSNDTDVPHPAASDPSQWVDVHGDALYRYALPRVGDAARAEDLVQETFLAALGARGSFAGKSSERTWLVAILRRKIVDHFRHVERRQAHEVPGSEVEAMFNRAGKWSQEPRQWPGDPVDAAQNREFWAVFQGCVSKLPEALAQTFLLREIDEIGADDLCKLLAITSSNLWTRLHRARLLLRRCLEDHWFSPS